MMDESVILEIVKDLDNIDATDPEGAHGEADDILLQCVDPRIRAAYVRVVDRAGAWWYA